jgi:quercetin dioxygenase-like cupin family protein
MTVTPARGYVLAPNEGPALWHLGSLVQFKATGAETDGQFWLLEGTARRGGGPPLHVHDNEDELFYVLEGELMVTLGDEQRVVGPGGVAYGPRSIPHTFKIVSDEARWLSFTTPAGFERFFFQSGEPAPSLTIPPPMTAPPDMEALAAALAPYGGRFA